MTQTRGRSKGGSRGKKAGSRGRKGGLALGIFGCNPPNFPPYANAVWGKEGDRCLQQTIQNPGPCGQNFFFDENNQQISNCSLQAKGGNMTAQEYYTSLPKQQKCDIWTGYNKMNKQSCGRTPGCKRFTPREIKTLESGATGVKGVCKVLQQGGCGLVALSPASLTSGGRRRKHKKSKKTKRSKRSHKRKTRKSKRSKRSHKRKTRKSKKTRRHRRRR